MSRAIEYLDTEDLVEFARQLLGEPVPLRDIGLLGAAAARPQASAFGEDAYPDVWTKAAALLHSVVSNHPLVDGNKRLGWLAAAVFFELNDASVSTAPDDAVYELVMAVATGARSVDDIASALRLMHEQTPPSAPASNEEDQASPPGSANAVCPTRSLWDGLGSPK